MKTYAHTPQGTAISGNPTKIDSLTYGNTAHPDRLTKFGSKSITYNAVGCPTAYDGKTFTWTNGKLTGVSESNTLTGTERYTYKYNAKGQRESKTYVFTPGSQLASDYVTRATTTYNYDNAGRLIREYRNETYKSFSSSKIELMYLYDETGMVGFNYTLNGVDKGVFYYQRNLFGDVVAIRDTSGVKQAGYTYDAFGNIISTYSGSVGVASINPIRYRGYYYDTETNWYFLNARYYSPEWRRFISPDDTVYLDPENVNGLNLYCYCNNDPVNYADPSGHEPLSNLAKWIIGGLAFAGAVALTAFTGGALLPLFIGMASSIVLGGLAGGVNSYLQGGDFWSGFADGSANGAMWGGITSLIGASIGAIRYGISAKGAVEGTQHFTTITKGQVFDRYGRLAGKYITDVGTPITKLALPAANNGVKTTLMATKNFRVITGVIADAFGGTGGGVQYVMRYSIETLIKMGWLIVIEQ